MKQKNQHEQMSDKETTAIEQAAAPECQDTTPQAAGSDEKMMAMDQVNRLVAEAEARGYLRGRNECAAREMNTPQLWENPRRTAMERECEPDPACEFLSKIRPGVWD